MQNSIRLHPKHGLNPCLDLCFWCGEAKGLRLLGNSYKEMAPHDGLVFDYQPCENCLKAFDSGTALIEVVEGEGQPIQGNLVPTGRWWVIKPEAAEQVFGRSERKMLIEPQVAKKLGLVNDQS